MPTASSPPQEGLFEGSHCLAGPNWQQWEPATLHRVNEDGTVTIELDSNDSPLMPYWYGVTLHEISFHDSDLWPTIFAKLSTEGKLFNVASFSETITLLGFEVSSAKAKQIWVATCQQLFSFSESQAKEATLDEAQSYRLLRAQGTSAKELWDALQPNRQKPYYKLYWNLTRMGGREPSEISRVVTLDDALAALGLAAAPVNASATTVLREIEQTHGVRLPENLSALIRRSGLAHAIHDCHPNSPRPFWMMEELVLRRNMRQEQLDGDYALTIMLPHQGNHEWAAVFDDGDQDARVYVGWEAEDGKYEWHLTAPSIGMFFWDLAQTGLTWYQDTQFDGGRPARRTDIGLIPVV